MNLEREVKAKVFCPKYCFPNCKVVGAIQQKKSAGNIRVTCAVRITYGHYTLAGVWYHREEIKFSKCV